MYLLNTCLLIRSSETIQHLASNEGVLYFKICLPVTPSALAPPRRGRPCLQGGVSYWGRRGWGSRTLIGGDPLSLSSWLGSSEIRRLKNYVLDTRNIFFCNSCSILFPSYIYRSPPPPFLNKEPSNSDSKNNT